MIQESCSSVYYGETSDYYVRMGGIRSDDKTDWSVVIRLNAPKEWDFTKERIYRSVDVADNVCDEKHLKVIRESKGDAGALSVVNPNGITFLNNFVDKSREAIGRLDTGSSSKAFREIREYIEDKIVDLFSRGVFAKEINDSPMGMINEGYVTRLVLVEGYLDVIGYAEEVSFIQVWVSMKNPLDVKGIKKSKQNKQNKKEK